VYQYDIMVAGHLCLDIIPWFPNNQTSNVYEIIRPGKLVNVGKAKISTGGPVSNTGLNMKTLGTRVCFCGCVGDDKFGQIAIELLQNSGNADGIKIIKGQASSYTLVIAPPGIDRIFFHNSGTNNIFSADYINSDMIRHCRHFHFGYPPLMKSMFDNEGDNLVEVFKTAKEAGATTSCDMSLPDPESESGRVNWRRVLERILPYVDMLLASLEETLYMLDKRTFLDLKKQWDGAELIDHLAPRDFSNLANEVLAMGAGVCSLKSGHRGFYIKTGDKNTIAHVADTDNLENWSHRELWAPAFVVEQFGSATGSGDSSIAGFLSAFLRGLTIEKALKYATCCGLQNVKVLDAVSGIKSWQETTDMIQDDMPLIDINCNDNNWIFNDNYKLWIGPEDTLAS